MAEERPTQEQLRKELEELTRQMDEWAVRDQALTRSIEKLHAATQQAQQQGTVPDVSAMTQSSGKGATLALPDVLAAVTRLTDELKRSTTTLEFLPAKLAQSLAQNQSITGGPPQPSAPSGQPSTPHQQPSLWQRLRGGWQQFSGGFQGVSQGHFVSGFQAMRQGSASLATNLSGAMGGGAASGVARMMGPVGLVAGGFIALGRSMYGFKQAQEQATERLLDYARQLAESSPSMATMMGMRQVQEHFRNMQMGEDLAGSYQKLIASEQEAKDSWRKVDVAAQQFSNWFKRQKNSISGFFGDVLTGFGEKLGIIADNTDPNRDVPLSDSEAFDQMAAEAQRRLEAGDEFLNRRMPETAIRARY